MLRLEGKGMNAMNGSGGFALYMGSILGLRQHKDHRAAKESIVRFPTKTMPTSLPVEAIFSCTTLLSTGSDLHFYLIN